MHLEHTFHVPAPTPDVWTALLDPHRVAPCMPGAALTAVEGTTFEGKVKVKLGPISLTYKGKGEFLTQDESTRTITIKATGKDTAGNGTASATVTVTLTPQGDATNGTVHTDLSITGKPAQFGRGLISEVGGKILDTFAACLSKKLAALPPEAEPAATATKPPPPGAGPQQPPPGTSEPPPPTAGPQQQPRPGTSEPPPPAAGPQQQQAPTGTPEPPPAAAASEQPPLTTTEPAPQAPTSFQRPTLAAVPEPEAEVDPIDLMAYAGRSVTKRAIPVALLLAVIGAIIAVAHRKRR